MISNRSYTHIDAPSASKANRTTSNPSTLEISELHVMRGRITDKHLRAASDLFPESADIVQEEREHLHRIQEIISRIIAILYSRIKKSEMPSWSDSETGVRGTTVNPSFSEYHEASITNATLYDDISEMEKLDKKPYFAHALVQFSDQDAPEDIFIGEKSIEGNKYSELTVISWQSPLGGIAYDTQNTSFLINGNNVDLQFRRKVEISNGYVIDVIEEFNRNKRIVAHVTEPMVYDSFLIKILREKRSHRELTNIIPSIQYNQNQIIRAPYNENFIVQGCAGCGKTMILLHRISYLLYNYRQYKRSSFLVLSPSRNFNAFIWPLITDLRLQGITVKSIVEYYLDILFKMHPKWKEIEQDIRIYGDTEVDRKVVDTLYSKNYAQALRERIPMRLKSLRITNDSIASLMKQKSIMHDKDPNADVSAINRQIRSLENRRRISIFDDEFKDLIPEGLHPGNRKIPICKAELYATVLVNYFCYGTRASFSFVFIDEAQDLAKQELILIKNLNATAFLNIYGDMNQRIYFSSISNWSELEAIGSFGQYILNENYRNTVEITQFVNDTLGTNMTALGLNGLTPMAANQKTIYEIAHHKTSDERIVAIISSTKVPSSVRLPLYGIPIAKVSEIKGMEFDTVIVFTEGMKKRERYIAFTRAIERLYVVEA